jgi:MYXO-CTERM domain-containing protein
MAARTTLLVATVTVFLAADPAAAQDLRALVSVDRTIPAGEHLVFRIDPAAGTLVFEDPTLRELSADQQAAVAAVPAWLAPDLAAAFWRMRPRDDPDELARLILEAEDRAYIDELGFLVSHLSPEDLQGMDRAIIPETVRALYERDAEIAFADLIEHGDADDPERYTTVVYRALRAGTPFTFELPREVYYWQIVHPVLEGEDVVYLDPLRHRSVDPPTGVHWRTYLWTDLFDRSYQAAAVLTNPNRITAATFTGWSLGGRPRAFSHFEGLEVGPLELIRAASGEPVAVAFTRGDQHCGSNDYPNPDGMYFATLSPVELAAANGAPELLHNLVRAGGGNADLLSSDLTVWDPLAWEPRRILIVRDRMPFELTDDPTEAAVYALGREWDVVGSAELDALVLSTDATPFVNPTYNKIIVPSDQPRVLYEALARNAEKLERFVDYGGTFELHGATRSADDWSDLRLPGGIRAAAQDGTHAYDTLAPYGYPLLSDVVPQAEYLWDFVPQLGLPGDRPFDPAGTALERLGWWVSQVVTWNIQEKVCWKRGGVSGRYLTPQEIAYDHFGNCGELQDLWTGGARANLIAIWNVGTLADDHMWNEVWQGEQWIPVQVDWSDNDTRLENWSVAYDADTGGGKTISGMDAFRGDGLSVAALGRYAPTTLDDHLWNDYSQHVTLEAQVEDADGNPVDGALVMIATPSLYDPSALTIAAWRHTGPDGVARVVVGEQNDYYVQITSSLGDYPDGEHVEDWVTEAEAVADAVFTRSFTLAGRLPLVEAEVVPPTGAPAGRVAGEVTVTRELLGGTSAAFDRTFHEPFDSGDVQLELLTEEQYALYFGGAPFVTAAAGRRGRTLTVDEPLPEGRFVLVVANRARVATEQQVAIHLELWDPDAGDDGEDAPDALDDADGAGETTQDAGGDGAAPPATVGGGGCGCRTTAPPAGSLLALLLLLPLRRIRRRRG